MMSPKNPLQRIPDLLHELDARVDRHPDYADYRNLRGLTRALAGDDDGARIDLQAALQRNPCYEAAILNLAWLYAEQGEVESLHTMLNARTQSMQSTRRGHMKMLDAYGRFGAQAALEVVESYAPRSAAPHDPWLELDRLWLLAKDGRYTEFDVQVQRVLHWKPEAESHFFAAGVLNDYGVDAAGAQVWCDAFRGNPLVTTVLRECARTSARQAREAPADELLHWGVALSLDLCDYWLSVGWRHDLEGRDLEAENAFRHAVVADPQRAQPYIQLGLLFAATADPRQAVAQLERAVELQPRYPDVRYMLGLLHQELGQIDDAEAEFRKALAIHPGYLMARLALGTLFESQGNLEDAIKMLELVRSSGVASADLEERLARIYERLGHADAATEARARAADLAQGPQTS